MYDHSLQTGIYLLAYFQAKFSQISLSHSNRFKAYSVTDTANQYTRLVSKILTSDLVFSNLIFGLLIHLAKKSFIAKFILCSH